MLIELEENVIHGPQ